MAIGRNLFKHIAFFLFTIKQTQLNFALSNVNFIMTLNIYSNILSPQVMVISFFGFQRIKADRYLPANETEKENGVQIHQFDIEKYEDVKKE